MRILYKIISCALITISFTGYANNSNTYALIELQFKGALLCKRAPVDGRDPKLAAKLDRYRIKVRNLNPNGAINLRYLFTKPLRLLNAFISVVQYQDDGRPFFYATAKGDMDEFVRLVEAESISPQLREAFSLARTNHYFKLVTLDPNNESLTAMILIGRKSEIKVNEFYFGCMYFKNQQD